jgi:hypothetical protein
LGEVKYAGRPPVLISKEEKTVSVFLTLAAVVAILAVGLTLGLVIRALPRADQPFDAWKLAIALAAFALTAFAILFAIFGRWPGSISTRSIIDLDAPPDRVWDAFALRDDYPGWKHIYTGIERLDEPGEVYRLHYAEDSDCARCSLPRDPNRSRWSSRIEVLEARRPSTYRLRTFPKALVAGAGADRLLDSEDSTLQLQPLPRGGTRLTYASTVVRPRMWLAFLTMFGRPAKEHLQSLKAHVEGTPDESLFGISAQRTEAARNAPKHCSCTEAR